MDYASERQAMVARLRRRQAVSDRVAAAMLAVPRHLFLPGVEPESAYEDVPIVTKRDEQGRPISSSSQPSIMATMLDQLGVEPGHRVLEIGAGTGYNAALLDHLAGPEGHVVTVDIDQDVAERARAHLLAAGRPRVEVVLGDGGQGHAARAPYDRLIATVGAWDLAPAWAGQLGAGGRLVAPLDLRGMQVSAAMERDGDHWTSRSVAPCGFMRMRGPFAGTETMLVLGPGTELMLELAEPRDLGDLGAALDAAPVDVATRVGDTDAPMPAAVGAGLWLALRDPRWCMLMGKLDGGYGMSIGLAERDNLAWLTSRQPMLARGHGPDAARLAEDLAAHVADWDEAGRPGADDLRIDAYPTGTPVPEGVGLTVRKRHTTLVVTYP
ncbi:methyltransferase, FxLD system [Nonomuraea sp. NN258]|uniref:methyltransferase, FxLD system n=1 Tax=Nonomuraea antri TaxID=2730852 RepID=UPI001567E282|nr:methyltransferase, FxLD system [Nonomuraea antri]NRQ39522.1 methyltransferase, FxLD system [Nonomuraea antri]